MNTLSGRNSKGFLFAFVKKEIFMYESEGLQMAIKRLDRDGSHRKQFERNKKKIYATQTVCGICGKPVDFSYTKIYIYLKMRS